MIAILKAGAPKAQIDNLIRWLQGQGLKIHISEGDYYTVLGLVGDTSKVDMELLSSLDIVQSVKRVSDPFKRCSRDFQPQDTVIEVGDSGVKIGGGNFCLIAGPCSVETHEQILEVARAVKAAGANVLRGGAFKPRTSPYSFQGLEDEGLKLLRGAGDASGLPIVTEIMDAEHIDMFEQCVDVIQVGARNMQNFNLLKQLGARTTKPILLKRGLSATIEEWLMSAEYIMSAGNENVILCERGVRTFETYTRNTLDLSAIPAIRRMSHLPIVVDPSHAAGMYWMVEPLAMAAVAVGADGLMVEVHNDPPHARCDGQQSLTPEKFSRLMGKIAPLVDLVGKKLV